MVSQALQHLQSPLRRPERGREILPDAGVKVDACPCPDAHYAPKDRMRAFYIAFDYNMKPGPSVDNQSSDSAATFMEMRVAFHLQRTVEQDRRYLSSPRTGSRS